MKKIELKNKNLGKKSITFYADIEVMSLEAKENHISIDRIVISIPVPNKLHIILRYKTA